MQLNSPFNTFHFKIKQHKDIHILNSTNLDTSIDVELTDHTLVVTSA